MRQAEKLHRPVLCFGDTSGAYCGIGAEERARGKGHGRRTLAGMMSSDRPR
ncbi:MAG: hypothetical protein ACLT9P_04390 [Evtepia gabavorous]